MGQGADQLESLAEDSRGGRVSRSAVKASGAAARKARAEEGQRAYEAEQRARAYSAEERKHDPFGARVPDHSVVHRYARCLSYPEWGVGTVSGVYFTGDGDSFQQWARIGFSLGVRTVPAGSLQFVDFSKPDPGADRLERFMTAAKNALAEGDFKLAAQRLVYARNADPTNTTVLRLLTLAFWQDGDLKAAGRAVRDWARQETDRPAPHRYAARIYEDMGALDLASEASQREVDRSPTDPAAWERLGRFQLRMFNCAGAKFTLTQARNLGPSVSGLLDLALACHLLGDIGQELSSCEQATQLCPDSQEAWSRYAHALARTDRRTECLAACERTLSFSEDSEITELRQQLLRTAPRSLSAQTAA